MFIFFSFFVSPSPCIIFAFSLCSKRASAVERGGRRSLIESEKVLCGRILHSATALPNGVKTTHFRPFPKEFSRKFSNFRSFRSETQLFALKFHRENLLGKRDEILVVQRSGDDKKECQKVTNTERRKTQFFLFFSVFYSRENVFHKHKQNGKCPAPKAPIERRKKEVGGGKVSLDLQFSKIFPQIFIEIFLTN
jgi:hypothetical protein